MRLRDAVPAADRAAEVPGTGLDTTNGEEGRRGPVSLGSDPFEHPRPSASQRELDGEAAELHASPSVDSWHPPWSRLA